MPHAASQKLPPNAIIGILGGGQLGRMLAMAAAELGFRVHVFAPDADDCPAGEVSAFRTQSAYDDEAALRRFANAVDVVTYEFENVPARTAEILASIRQVRPGARALAVAQDRLPEKDFITSLGIETAPYAAVDDDESARAAFRKLGPRAVLKTRQLGYDGKGQAKVSSEAETVEAFARFMSPSILEGFIDFEREVSVIAARSADGGIEAYDVVENEHRNHILHRTIAPARVASTVNENAREIAARILANLDYVGVIGVELFLTRNGRLLVNEIAPRVHNSGHWTLDACATSQFEQHIRAVAGWPLRSAARHSNAEMINLIGDDAKDWEVLAAEPNACIHFYGKRDIKPGRKMGHVTRLFAKE